MTRWAVLCSVMLVATGLDGRPVAAQASSAATSVEQITVVGRYPGPPLWRVSSGERVLFVFGELAPVPKGLVWDPRNAELALQRAEVVIGTPRVEAQTFNPIRLFRVFRSARRLSRNPERAPLATVLPPELYARYAALKARYLPRDENAEEDRPALAALRLYRAALDGVGLTNDADIDKTLAHLVRRARVERKEVVVETKPETVLEELAKVPRDAELACFSATLASIESDLDGMTTRANAWAVGDVAALKRFDYPDSRGDCLDMLMSVRGLSNLRDELYARWLDEAERALRTRARSFSALPMRELVASDGLLARLAARGYTVTAP